MSAKGSPFLRVYREQQIETQEPGRTLLMVLDVARRACRQKDGARARKAVEELIGSLDVSRGEVARGLFIIYEYLLRKLAEEDFAQTARFLDELRETWDSALGGGEPTKPAVIP